MTDTTDYASFRQRLDQALRSRDVRQVRAFLIEEGQWTLDQPENPEYAMWLMIAGTPTLKDLHSEASQWLIGHGHGEAAEAVLGHRQASGQRGKSTGKQKTNQRKKNSSASSNAPAQGQGKPASKLPRQRGPLA
jgi:hypothetical protein